MILDYIKKENIAVNAEAFNWEDAIKIAGDLLLKNGYIEERYIQEMIAIVKDVGPYIVIDEGIALANARPEHGAKCVGLSLVTLKKPIEFGNEDNDPVKIIIGLSATEADSHIELISELATLLEDEKSIKRIIASRSREEVYRIIKEVYC